MVLLTLDASSGIPRVVRKNVPRRTLMNWAFFSIKLWSKITSARRPEPSAKATEGLSEKRMNGLSAAHGLLYRLQHPRHRQDISLFSLIAVTRFPEISVPWKPICLGKARSRYQGVVGNQLKVAA